MQPRHIPFREVASRGLLLIVAFFLGWSSAQWVSPTRWLSWGHSSPPQCSVITEAWQLIQQHYVASEAVQPEHMKQAALSALLSSLGDTGHTSYVTAEQFQQMQRSLRGQADNRRGGSQPSVSWAVVPGRAIALLAIHDFSSLAHDELKQALHEIRKRGIQGLIVDLRGCPGGWREQAITVTSEFLKDGDVMWERDATGQLTAVPVQAGGTATELPLCLLIDSGTASSAEIFAGAMQDHDRGPLIGTRTFGAGTLLQPFPLSDGSAILLAVAEWRTPNGRQVWHKGLTPDIKVELPPGVQRLTPTVLAGLDAETLAASEDTQFLRGLQKIEDDLSFHAHSASAKR